MPGIGDIAKDARAKLVTEKGDKNIPSMADINAIVGFAFSSVMERVAKDEVVSVQGMGNFRVVDRKATKARNPQTGAQFDVAASKRLKFTASKTARESLNQGKAAATPAPAAKAAKAKP